MPKRPNKKGMVLDVDPLWAAEHQGEEIVMEDAFAQEVRHDAVHPFYVRSLLFYIGGILLFLCSFFYGSRDWLVCRPSKRHRSPPGMSEEMKRYRNCRCNVDD